jgi:hypothetical protein
MNLAQIIEVLPLQVYARRGELVIHFSNPADLIARLAETSAALAELEASRGDGKPERLGRRGPSRPAPVGNGRSEGDVDGPGNDPDQPARTVT